MRFSEFYGLVKHASECESLERFRLREGPAISFHDKIENYDDVMQIAYAASRGDFKGAIHEQRLTEISQAFGIPYDTIQKWNSGTTTPPPYVITLIAFAVASQLAEVDEEEESDDEA